MKELCFWKGTCNCKMLVLIRSEERGHMALETVRIKLVKDFIDEPMFVAKFSHPLNCILECALINIVGM